MFAAERFEEITYQIFDHDDIRSSSWFINQVIQLQGFLEYLVAVFTGHDEDEHRWIFMKAALGIDDEDELRIWTEKHIWGLPGYKTFMNADGVLNVMLREAKAAWAQMRPVSMPG